MCTAGSNCRSTVILGNESVGASGAMGACRISDVAFDSCPHRWSFRITVYGLCEVPSLSPWCGKHLDT